ncbi:hypothetical protein ACX80R_13430 [Paeniglutamicibacter antarcticus]
MSKWSRILDVRDADAEKTSYDGLFSSLLAREDTPDLLWAYFR